ncbi:LysR family transcriptional regulator [Francisella sp. Scap27]|uniref:LysR family transcriptional regulator n=1 Tax=Francisella sp. Scap27 TaxID=2589986 RepID=UPI0015BF717E|nr:LysR family transcriptional regulator [Francisella sp. Scap27]QLE79375.1 LysR family transcriptional regulator [Francisella sp. Scap27]
MKHITKFRYLNSKRLIYLYQVISLGSIRSAADKLNISPSSISRQISLLEQELSCTLIQRHNRGVVLTEAGKTVLDFYHKQQLDKEICISKLQALQGLQSGHIKLSIGEGFITDLMMNFIPDFNRKYPGITISISVDSTNDMLRKIETGESHIALAFNPSENQNINSVIIADQPVYAIASPEHELAASQKNITLKQLGEYPIALQENNFGIRSLLAKTEIKKNVCLKPVLTTNSISTLKYFALSGVGITFLPKFVVSEELNSNKLIALKTTTEGSIMGQSHLLVHAKRELPECSHKFLQLINSWMEKN